MQKKDNEQEVEEEPRWLREELETFDDEDTFCVGQNLTQTTIEGEPEGIFGDEQNRSEANLNSPNRIEEQNRYDGNGAANPDPSEDPNPNGDEDPNPNSDGDPNLNEDKTVEQPDENWNEQIHGG